MSQDLEYVFGSRERITCNTQEVGAFSAAFDGKAFDGGFVGRSRIFEVDGSWHVAPDSGPPDIMGWDTTWVEG